MDGFPFGQKGKGEVGNRDQISALELGSTITVGLRIGYVAYRIVRSGLFVCFLFFSFGIVQLYNCTYIELNELDLIYGMLIKMNFFCNNELP